MLTARRMREKQAAEKAGLPPPPAPRPTSIPYDQHLSEVNRLTMENKRLLGRIAELEAAAQPKTPAAKPVDGKRSSDDQQGSQQGDSGDASAGDDKPQGKRPKPQGKRPKR